MERKWMRWNNIFRFYFSKVRGVKSEFARGVNSLHYKGQTIECHENFVCSYPKKSLARENNMVQEDDNIDTCISNTSNVASLDEDVMFTLDPPSLEGHLGNLVDVMNTHIGSPLIIEPPKSPHIIGPNKRKPLNP